MIECVSIKLKISKVSASTLSANMFKRLNLFYPLSFFDALFESQSGLFSCIYISSNQKRKEIEPFLAQQLLPYSIL